MPPAAWRARLGRMRVPMCVLRRRPLLAGARGQRPGPVSRPPWLPCARMTGQESR